jgi:hypothetical protein
MIQSRYLSRGTVQSYDEPWSILKVTAEIRIAYLKSVALLLIQRFSVNMTRIHFALQDLRNEIVFVTVFRRT